MFLWLVLFADCTFYTFTSHINKRATEYSLLMPICNAVRLLSHTVYLLAIVLSRIKLQQTHDCMIQCLECLLGVP